MKQPKILVVDDDEDMLLMISFHFEKVGAYVEKTQDPKTACALVKAAVESNEEFNLVVTDIRMPLLNGNQFAKAIKEIGYSGKVVAFTAAASGEGRVESIESGIDRYFNKSTLSKELVQALIQELC